MSRSVFLVLCCVPAIALAADGSDAAQAAFTYQLIATLVGLSPVAAMFLAMGRRAGTYEMRVKHLEDVAKGNAESIAAARREHSDALYAARKELTDTVEKMQEQHGKEIATLRADFRCDLKDGLTDAVARINESIVLRMGVVETKITSDLGKAMAQEIRAVYRDLPRDAPRG